MKPRTFLLVLSLLTAALAWSADEFIPVQTDGIDLILKVTPDGRLLQSYLGRRLLDADDYRHLPGGHEAYATRGTDVYYEPALDVVHADGNPSTFLRHTAHTTSTPQPGVRETVITLQDSVEPLTVRLHYVSYAKENVIRTWTEIENRQQKKPVRLEKFASSMLYFYRPAYHLTQFHGDWAQEAQMSTTRLDFGRKVLSSSLGTRANMFSSPQFILSLGNPATETTGEALLGQLGWTGNYRFTFEIDADGWLRVIAGINHENSERLLMPGETFRTADFYFTLTDQGLQKGSHNLHDWARRHQLKNGGEDRMTLLNNWEATYFDFNQEKLVSLMDDAVKLGVDMFLLDDGWFGEKYPRSGDRAGLGDWKETPDKLPDGIAHLCQAAREKGIRFGIWIEPEMVNRSSRLYEQHPEWVLKYPNREAKEFRHQLTLDLTNPQVQDYVFGIVDTLMTKYPEIAFFKWDCNSPIMNPYSPWLAGEENLPQNQDTNKAFSKKKGSKRIEPRTPQSHLYVDYVRGLYNVLERIKAKYPHLPMMMCAGGSGRIDYKGLEFFTEFWASDNTDPIERLFIQYGYSYFYPSKAVCAHVTTWNSQTSVKFRTDVASMGKLGFDIKLSDMSSDEITYASGAVANWKRLRPVILEGDLYRLVSPYDGQHAATSYVSKDKSHAVLFAFDIRPRRVEHPVPVRLRGLDPSRKYRIEEINLMPGQKAWTGCGTYSGDYLMSVGLDILSLRNLCSHVLEITEE